MSKELDLRKLSKRDAVRAIDCSALLTDEQHSPECPVRHQASVSCVLLLVACVFEYR